MDKAVAVKLAVAVPATQFRRNLAQSHPHLACCGIPLFIDNINPIKKPNYCNPNVLDYRAKVGFSRRQLAAYGQTLALEGTDIRTI